MSSYILVHRKDVDKRWWNNLVKACAVVGDTFEIHCWSDETAETLAALQYGQKVKTSWSGGTVICGRITREFLSFLTEAKKPTDTEISNKMTPFFTIVFGNKLHSEHYGTEIIISKVIREKQPAVDRIWIRCQKWVRYIETSVKELPV